MIRLTERVQLFTKSNAIYDGKEYQDKLNDFADSLKEYMINTNGSDITRKLARNMGDNIKQDAKNFIIESFTDMEACVSCFVVVHKETGKAIYLSANKD